MKALEYLLSRPLLVTPEAFETAIAIVTREDRAVPEAVEAKPGTKMDGAEAGMYRRGSVAVIPMVGPVFRYADFFTDMCGGVTVERVARDLCTARDDPSVSAVVLAIDSPGGEVTGVAELAAMIRAAAGVKPVVAYVEGLGASAAYWLASAAGEIVCESTAILGSIGVVTGYVKRDDPPGRRSYEFVSSQSPNKRPDPATEKGRAEIQRTVDDLAEVFIAAVAEYRDTTPEKVASDFGQGGVLVGQKAVDAGMADRVGSFESVLEELAAHGRPGVPGRAGASANGPAAEGNKLMFGFSFKPKADGSIAVEPLASEADNAAARITAAEPLKPAAPSAEAQAAAAQIEAMRREMTQLNARLIATKADGWYNALFASRLIVPAEKADAVAAYTQAAIDDAVSPLADGKTRVSLVEGIFKARTPHTLTREQLGAGAAGAIVLPPGFQAMEANASQADAPPTEAELKSYKKILVDAGMLGREALAN